LVVLDFISFKGISLPSDDVSISRKWFSFSTFSLNLGALVTDEADMLSALKSAKKSSHEEMFCPLTCKAPIKKNENASKLTFCILIKY
jgi:hypothetical protein